MRKIFKIYRIEDISVGDNPKEKILCEASFGFDYFNSKEECKIVLDNLVHSSAEYTILEVYKNE